MNFIFSIIALLRTFLRDAIEELFATQKELLADMVMEHYSGDVAGKTFALWGLAFKPRTDDVREAPALTLLEPA